MAQGVLFALAVPPLWSFTRRICAAPVSAAPVPGAPAGSGSGGPAFQYNAFVEMVLVCAAAVAVLPARTRRGRTPVH